MTAVGQPRLPPPAGRYSPLPPPPPHAPSYTVDTAIESIGLGLFQYIVLALAGLCWTAESMEMLLLSFIKQPLQCEWAISDSRAAFITTCVAIGMLAGSTFWGLVADKQGRKFSFIASTAFTCFLGLASAASLNFYMMFITRGLVGFGIGGVPVAFSLLMEFLPASQRGSWGMSLAFFWAIGAIFEALVAMYVLPALGWRWLIIVSTIPLLLVLLASFWLSESPRWLAAKGRFESAEHIIHRISRINHSSVPDGHLSTHATPQLSNEDAMRRDIELAFSSSDALMSPAPSPVHRDTPGASQQPQSDTPDDFIPPEEGSSTSTPALPSSKVSSLFRRGARGLIITILFIWFVCAFVYYGLVMVQPELISSENVGKRCNYAASECAGAASAEATCNNNPICTWKQPVSSSTSPATSCVPTGTISARQAEQPSSNPACSRQLTRDDFISTLWASVGELPGVLVAFATVDIVGRRPLLGYMFGVLVLSFIALSFCISRAGETAVFFVSRGAASGAFQAMYLYTTEMYPAVIRASAMGLSSSMARVGLIITPFVAQFLTNIDEKVAMGSYLFLSVLAVLAVIALPIETTGRPSVDSMEELVQSLRAARTMGAEQGTSFAKDPSVHPIVRFLRWNATLDGVTVR